jgi:two-component system, chemotaxis family, chemotaxis protein CheY
VIALIVDDARLARVMARSFLQDLHPEWHAIDVASGYEALALLKNGEKIDMLFVDQNMPGLDGLQLTVEARALYPRLPIVMITANAQDSIRQQAENLGILFLEKPLTQAKLKQLMPELEKQLALYHG